MLSQFPEALNVYLFPFLIALPIAIVLYLLVARRDDPPASPPAPTDGVQRLAMPADAATAAQPPANESATAPADAKSPATLLLVDDSAVVRTKLRRLFEGAGYAVELAKDGAEALTLLSQHPFALLITDLEMPNMDGIELIGAVHGNLDTEDMPILAITGHDDLHAKVHECQGLYGIFKKPWNDRELLRRVEALVRLRQAATSPAPASH